MTKFVMLYHPVSTTIIDTTHVAMSSMFITSSKTHFYGVPSVPPDYQSLYDTFSGVAYSPRTYLMSSSSRILSSTSLMITIQYALSPPSTPTIEQQPGTYVNGYGHLQQLSPLHIGNPHLGGQFPPYSHPVFARGKTIVGVFPSPHKISQVSAQPHLSPPHLGMNINFLQPTFPI